MAKYTIEQFDKHGDLIREFENDTKKVLRWEITPSSKDEWEIVPEESQINFRVNWCYRIKKQPLFTNDLGEQFFEEDGEVYYVFRLKQENRFAVEERKHVLSEIINSLDGRNNKLVKETQIAKSPASAYKLLAMMLENE